LFLAGGGSGGVDFALNSFSAFGFNASSALSSATSTDKDAMSSFAADAVDCP
jgi:hypothetical protein